jgi:methylmalonyl-CoA mutase C-terminal domain/subunit
MALFPETIRLIRQKGGEGILVVGGGIIPKKDIPKLKEAGIAQIFGPGTAIEEIAGFIKKALESKGDDKKD